MCNHPQPHHPALAGRRPFKAGAFVSIRDVRPMGCPVGAATWPEIKLPRAAEIGGQVSVVDFRRIDAYIGGIERVSLTHEEIRNVALRFKLHPPDARFDTRTEVAGTTPHNIPINRDRRAVHWN